jgi:hypothetical protein
VFGGDAHFDDDERWTKGTFSGKIIEQEREEEN